MAVREDPNEVARLPNTVANDFALPLPAIAQS